MALGCFVSTGRSFRDAIERVKLAESLGYESVYTTHVAGRESLTVLTAFALLTAVGVEDAVVDGVERYRSAGASSPCLAPIAKTDFEATLRAGVASTGV